MANVILKDVVKVYGNFLAVRGINLDIREKELTVFVGPSGCGKSTTLRMIAGLESISHGELLMDGVLVNELPSKDRGVAMVFQSYALYPHKTVRANLDFSLKLEKLPKDEIESRVEAAVSVLELGPYMDRKPAQLSGGQRQRVAMGRAIVRQPKVFLFDEPLSNLDAKLRNQMRIEIKKLQQELQVTTIYVTHDQIEAMTLADTIVVMNDGYVEQSGTPEEIFERPINKFVAGFIGTPQMNFFEGSVAMIDGKAHFKNEILSAPIPLNKTISTWQGGEPISLGLRPEEIVPDGHGLTPESSVTIHGKVDFAEMLGHETLLFMKSTEDDFVSRMTRPRTVQLNEEIAFEFNVEKMHIFDGESGLSTLQTDI